MMTWVTLKKFLNKKALAGVVVVGVIGGGGVVYKHQEAQQPLRYVLAQAERGTLIVSVSGSGQVSGKNQVDVKPTVSGALTKILVQQGQEVHADDPLFEIDAKDAQKTVRDAAQLVKDAQLSLQSAELSFQKTKQGADALALLQSQNTLDKAKRDLEDLLAGPDASDVRQAEQELASQQENAKISSDGITPVVIRQSYDDAIALVQSTLQTLEKALYDGDAIIGVDHPSLNDAYEQKLSATDSGRIMQAQNAYFSAKSSVALLDRQSGVLRAGASDIASISAAMSQARTAIDAVTTYLDEVHSAVVATVPSPNFSQSNIDSLRSGIESDQSSLNSKQSSLLTQEQAFDKARSSYTSALNAVEKARLALEKVKKGADASAIADARARVAETQASYDKLKAGADSIEIATAQNSIAQRRASLVTAQNRYADAVALLKDYTIRAPFDGVVTNLPVSVKDSVSPSTVLATLITQAKIAELSLNEIDATKVKVGQKATLTFDAISDLSIAGVVSDVDAVGTVSQGVVSYGVRIALVTDDERVKPGMSVSAMIVTDVRQNVVLVPSAAVKSQGNARTVSLASDVAADQALASTGVELATVPRAQMVQTGLSNDQSVEITQGVQEGDYVVLRTIDPNTTAAAATPSSANGSLRIPGVTGGAGGFGGGMGGFTGGGNARFQGR